MESDEIDLVELVKICGRKTMDYFICLRFVPPLRQAMLQLRAMDIDSGH